MNEAYIEPTKHRQGRWTCIDSWFDLMQASVCHIYELVKIQFCLIAFVHWTSLWLSHRNTFASYNFLSVIKILDRRLEIKFKNLPNSFQRPERCRKFVFPLICCTRLGVDSIHWWPIHHDYAPFTKVLQGFYKCLSEPPTPWYFCLSIEIFPVLPVSVMWKYDMITGFTVSSLDHSRRVDGLSRGQEPCLGSCMAIGRCDDV